MRSFIGAWFVPAPTPLAGWQKKMRHQRYSDAAKQLARGYRIFAMGVLAAFAGISTVYSLIELFAIHGGN
jgi:hypothetical protein